MTGTSTWATMSGTARAASSLFTVTRTSSEPAWWRARTWATVPSTSAVSVLVIDWTTIGWAEPTGTPPTEAVTARRDRKSTRLNSSHSQISYAVFCLKKKKARDGDYLAEPGRN